MKVVSAVALVTLAAVASSCQPDAGPRLNGAEKSVVPASEAAQSDVGRGECRSTLTASVRGVTGSFSSAEEAARSVKELPPEGSLTHLNVGEGSVAFGWMEDGKLT